MFLSTTLLLLGSATASARGEDPEAEAPRQALTIYSAADPATFDPRQFLGQQQRQVGFEGFGSRPAPGYGVVREIRSIDLAGGIEEIPFAEVASAIDPTTVSFRSITDPDAIAVLEQRFEYDLVGSAKLLQKYLGKPVTIHRESADGGRTSLTAPLLAQETAGYNIAGRLVLGGSGPEEPVRIVPIGEDVVEIELPEPAAGLVTEPTLTWLVDAQEAGRREVELSYQTGGLTWRADYNVVVEADETEADLGAWVTILNESGASYRDAALKLIAGDVRHIEPQQNYGGGFGGMGGGMSRDEGFKERPFFEYHLYTLGRLTSLPNHSVKQIELFPSRRGVDIEKVFVYYGAPPRVRHAPYEDLEPDRDLGVDGNTDVDVYLRLRNDEAHGLGLPLPAGRVRVYLRDEADGAAEFVGEDIIDHTPEGEEILSRLGSAFDIVGERTQVDFSRDGNERIRESFEIKVRNHKDTPAEVLVRETLYRWLNWEIDSCSHEFEKVDSRTIQIPITVEPGAEETVMYTVEYNLHRQAGGVQ